jgi:hypothetical protein
MKIRSVPAEAEDDASSRPSTVRPMGHARVMRVSRCDLVATGGRL